MKNIVFPDYENSLLNLMNSVLKNYKVNLGYPTLKDLDLELEKDYRNVVVYLIDAMGSEILNKHKNESKFLRKNKLRDITTVFPSTTVAATTTATSGLPPIASAWIGWNQYIKEVDKNIVFFLNQDYYDENIKFDYNISQKYVKYTNIYDRIKSVNDNVNTFEIFPEFRIKEHKTIKDQVESVIKATRNSGKNYIYAYWDKLDTYLHEYGTLDLKVKNHIKEIEDGLEYLANNIDHDTLVIVTADHGQVDIEGINLWEYEDIMGKLRHLPSVESRATSFYVKDGEEESFVERFNYHFRDKYILYKSEDLIEMKLFGPGEINPKTKSFLGDYFAIAIDKYSFRFQNAGHVHKATHAGLLRDEMMIPIILLNKKSQNS